MCRINFAKQFTQADGEIAHALHELRITRKLSNVTTHSIDLGRELRGISGCLLELTQRLGIVEGSNDVVDVSRCKLQVSDHGSSLGQLILELHRQQFK